MFNVWVRYSQNCFWLLRTNQDVGVVPLHALLVEGSLKRLVPARRPEVQLSEITELLFGCCLTERKPFISASKE